MTRSNIIDKFCGVILVAGVVGSMTAMVAYANYRDTKGINNYASVPTRPEEIQLEYLDELPPVIVDKNC